MGILDPNCLRILRVRTESPAGRGPRAAEVRGSRGTPRLLGRVANGGAMPDRLDRVFLVNPARIAGDEAEGATASISADGSRTIPVLVIGSRVPSVGDPVVALSVGGRWVAESGPGDAAFTCSPCKIPRKNLIVSWVNPILGNGNAGLTYAASGQWTSDCVHGLIYTLSCPGSALRFGVSYFLSGDCPTGQRQTCSNMGPPPLAISLSSYTCGPFYLKYLVVGTGCPVLASAGYSSFTVTE